MSSFEDLKLLNVLYADDDETILSSIEKTLKLMVNHVYSVSDGNTAYQTYLNEHVDIVILDIRMGSVGGIEVAQKIRKDDKTIPIIITSSYTETDDLLEACKLNLIEYIKKPVDLRHLIDSLYKALEQLRDTGLLIRKITEDVSYNYLSKSLVRGAEVIPLTKNEISIIELLLAQRGKLVIYEVFFNVLEDEMSDGALKNLMLRLRKKIGEDKCIRNLSRIGYTLI